MDEYIKVAKAADVKEDKPYCAEVNGQRIALFRIEGTIYATTGICTHAGGPLCEGKLEGGIVTCPWHGSKFEVISGKVVQGPAETPVKTYPTRIVGEDVEVELV